MTTSVLGGALIGTAAGVLFLLEGRIAGVSGMLAGVLDRSASDRWLRLAFVAGLVSGGAITERIMPGALAAGYTAPAGRLIAAGLLVGIGARLANGCTSGHALCGVARGSMRSLVALGVFVTSGMITVAARRLVGG